ncbi:MAG: chromosome segregation protein SMC [Candidatus Binataceae bacterium]|nr:chromosome segregation protein SMC [Candidatus Binataceae bacterium]
MVWRKPGELLREITLRPGLNIIWSPDPADQIKARQDGDAMGHGGGKSMLCRLIRYCLGEDHFATDEQRNRVALAFPEGLVGAEVMVAGIRWAILRPIGTGRKHFAIREGNLDDIKIDELTANGTTLFLQAIENGILSPDVAALVPGDRPLHAWLIALAWLSRDQDCRFDHVLDWRSPVSDSGSPVRSFSTTRVLDALRALIGAIDPEEHKVRAEISELETEHQSVLQEVAHRKWEAARLRSRLLGELGLQEDQVPPDRLAVEQLRQTAKVQLARTVVIDADTDIADIETLRAADDEAWRRLDAAAKAAAEVEARIPEIERMVSRIKGEMPTTAFAIHSSENPVCPICEVPIDRALAEGCKLSHKLPDPDQLKARRESLENDFKCESLRLEEHRNRLPIVNAELASARQAAKVARNSLRSAEKARDARADAWYQARRRIDDTDRLGELLIVIERTQSSADELFAGIEKKREHVGAHRDAQAEVFGRLSRTFDAIIRVLVGSTARGAVTLDGKGLHLTVDMGGDRSTTAIESLKIVAFDLAVMCVSIEGKAHVPAFLIHDSPREADLGLSIYHQLFEFVHGLEDVGRQPLFQYIITTTTRPPDNLTKKPWLRETLRGAPAEERLMRQDL